ncbi:DM13 domain-containing protein [Flagellimonas onchidii]|uniref:DM13 domain-containing protein n=1 Tax=Flagellimonas onchidii TaxID=2562684 RepID=UPI001F0D64D5|nr:DM13 domain-containing protein [Allomuricauda onchidii]
MTIDNNTFSDVDFLSVIPEDTQSGGNDESDGGNNSDDTKSGTIETTSGYLLQGDFTIVIDGDGNLFLEMDSNYRADTDLPGLYLYLTNNPNSVNGAHEVGAVEVFSGEHFYTIENVGLNEFKYLLYWCKPFSVKVGDGKIN